MKKFWDLDGPVMRVLSVLGTLAVLNLFTVLLCLPIVTAGAGFTALHSTCFRLADGEDFSAVRHYWKAFRRDFRQATPAWLLLLAILAVIGGNLWIFLRHPDVAPKALKIVVCIFSLLLLIASAYLFPLLSHFSNPLALTLKNSAILGFCAFPKALLMLVLIASPLLLFYLLPAVLPMLLLYGISAPVFACVFLYRSTFRKLSQNRPA
jgi:uncharacterized membrane protein YesL